MTDSIKIELENAMYLDGKRSTLTITGTGNMSKKVKSLHKRIKGILMEDTE